MWIVTKEAVVGIVRTGVTYAYATLLAKIPAVDSWLTDNGLADGVKTFLETVFVVAVGTILYAVIRWAAEKWPNAGRLLIFNTKPSYDG